MGHLMVWILQRIWNLMMERQSPKWDMSNENTATSDNQTSEKSEAGRENTSCSLRHKRKVWIRKGNPRENFQFKSLGEIPTHQMKEHWEDNFINTHLWRERFEFWNCKIKGRVSKQSYFAMFYIAIYLEIGILEKNIWILRE